MSDIRPGLAVFVRTAFGNEVPRIATTGVEPGHKFSIVWVCSAEEWDAALREGRNPVVDPWPADAVRQART